MAQAIGQVIFISGAVKAVDSVGNERELDINSMVFLGETIVTEGTDSRIMLKMDNNQSITMGRNDKLTLDEDIYDPTQMPAEESIASVESIQEALLNDPNFDPSQLEAAAAGGEAGPNDSSAAPIVITHATQNVEFDFLDTSGVGNGVSQANERDNQENIIPGEIGSETNGTGATINVGSSVTSSPTSNPSGTDGGSPGFSVTVPPSSSSYITDESETQTINEDGTASGNVLDNTYNRDGSSSVTSFSVAGQTVAAGGTATIANVGTLTIAANGAYTFTPETDYNGDMPQATYTVVDDTDATDTTTSTLDVTVTPVADTLTDGDESQTIDEGDTATGNVLANTTNVDGSSSVTEFTVAGQTVAAGGTATIANVGTLTIAANGAYTFTPEAGYIGTMPQATYTVVDDTDATDTNTSTLDVTVVDVNDIPVSNTDLYSVVENSTSTLSTVLINDTDSDSGPNPLTVSQVSSDGGVTSVSVNGSNSITTALGGTVVMNQDGTFTYTAPVRIHNDLISDQDSFVYKSSDGEDQSSWTTVNIDITDTNPVADFDFDVVDMGDSTSGNVLSNDTIIDSPNERLTAIEFNGTTYDSFDLNGNLTITTDSGILTINQDGSYNYTSTLFTTAGGSNGLADWSDLSITAFNGARTVVADNEFFIDGTTYLPTSNNILSLTGTGSLTVVDDVLGDGTDGIGIAEGSGNSTYLNGHPTNPEAILLNFGNDISSADVNFYSGTNSGVPFYWATYDSDGNFVDSGNGAISKPTFTLNIENTSSDPFQYVVFYGVDSSASSKVLITDVENIEYADLSPDVFNYTVMDADGDTDVSSLTINQVGIGDDVATVFEAGLSDGTDPTADTVVTGNILANDQGLSATTSITSVEGNSSIINGTITVTTALGQLVVYTEASASHNAGDYIYTLNDNSVAGDNVIDSFNYVVTDSSDNSTFDANLIVNVVDDAPVATSMVKNLQVDDSVFTTNLVIVLDSSGSMGTTRMQLAKDALKYMISGYDDIGNVNIQIVDFDSSVNESQWFTDDVSSANDFIDNVTSGGTTHYDDALNAVIDDFSKPAADQTLVYFLSDGNPYPGTNGVDDTVVYTDSLGVEHTGSSAWEKFVDENVDKAYGVGIGTNVDTDLGLNSIAYPGSAILVEDESELSTTLYDSINTGYVSGSVSVFDSDTSGIVLGADGGHIESITIDGTTYNYDPSTPEVTYTTALGASLTFNFETGAYYYGITLDDSNYGQVETFSLVAIDNDGDTVSSDFSVNLNFKADFDANVDTIITNSIVGDDLVIPDTALLANDTGSNSINSTFDAVGGAVTHNTTTTTFNTGGDFGTVASVINESTVLPGDTESNPLNNSLQTAYDLTDRSLYGQVSAADSSYLGDSTLPSVKYVGAIGDESDSDSDHDSDWLKVSLQKGEKIILDVDFGIGGNSDESTDTYLYIRNSDGDIIAQNDDAPNSSTGGLGSSSRYDSYLEYSAPENGEYYIQVTTYDAVNNNNDNEGTYDLWLSIDNSAIESSSFDYDIVGVSKTDSTTVDITYQTGDTVQGGSEDEILIGRDNANDTLIAGDGDDILIGTSGNDTFIGDAGADLFVFGNSSQGNNVIDDFNQGEGDTLIFSDLLISASDELSAHLTLDADSNGDTIITVTDNNTTVTLKDVKLDSLNIDTNNPLGDLMTSIKSDIEPDSI